MNPIMTSIGLLLICSNVFMTFAWYAHLKEHESQTLDHRRPGELGIAPVRIPVAGARQPHRPHRALRRPAQDPAGGDHPHRVRSPSPSSI